MRKRWIACPALGLGIVLSIFALHAAAQPNDEQAIRSLHQRYANAVRARDIHAIMSVYVPNDTLFVFDAVPPRQYVGARAYAKDYEEFFALFPGPIEYRMSDLSITTSRTLAFSHHIDTWDVRDKDRKHVRLVFRLTDVYRKINGRWLIVHEHISFPVDPTTGKADMLSKP